MERRIVILTKSAMHGGSCVAGIDIDSGRWVRLVSDVNGSSLGASYMSYCNANGQCQPLDVVSVDVIGSVPIRNQKENCMIKACSMSKICTCSLSQVLQFHRAENHQYIFGNESKRLTEDDMQGFNFNHSLILVYVHDLMFTTFYGKNQANFIYNKIKYKYMNVTDPEYFAGKIADGTKFDHAYLVVSMPKEPYNKDGCYYKFIAKVFPV